jgi:hypothetical protein
LIFSGKVNHLRTRSIKPQTDPRLLHHLPHAFSQLLQAVGLWGFGFFNSSTSGIRKNSLFIGDIAACRDLLLERGGDKGGQEIISHALSRLVYADGCKLRLQDGVERESLV